MDKSTGKILHLGVVVRDLDKAMKLYEEKLHIGPWITDDPIDFFKDKIVGDDRGLQIKTGMYKGDGFEIELVMPVGPGFYQDWLEEHGPGVHHVVMKLAHNYDQLQELGQELEENSHYMDAKFPDGRPIVSYIDFRESMGLLLEISAEE